MLDVLHDVAHDVVDLRRRKRPGAEARHVARPGPDGFPDHRLGHSVQRWCLDAPGKSVSGACDRVAGRAVEGEQAETFSHIRMGDVDSGGDPRIAERRRQGRHVAHDVENLGSVELCRFALGFGRRLGEWHPPA